MTKFRKSITKYYHDFKRYLWFRKHGLKTIDVKKVVEDDLQRLGRKIDHEVSYSRKDVKPYLITMENESPEAIKEPKRTVQLLRNKKNGRVVVFPGDLKQIKSTFGDDWEIVESEVK